MVDMVLPKPNMLSYEEKLASLIQKAICPYGDEEQEIRNIRFILSSYDALLDNKQCIPFIEDIVDIVLSFNNEIVEEIVETVYNQRKYDLEEGVDKSQLCSDLCDDITQQMYDYVSDIEPYVKEVLDAARMSYKFSECHSIMTFFNNGENVVANDCQNILIGKILVEGQKYLEDVFDDVWRYQIIEGEI